MNMKEVLLSVRKEVQAATLWRPHLELARSKSHQKMVFESLKPQYRQAYASLEHEEISRYVTKGWENFNTKLRAVLWPNPPFGFLRNPTMMYTMFVTAGGRQLARQLAFLEENIPSGDLRELLAEDYVGSPLLLNAEYRTSHNSIHHLYHLIRFQQATGCRVDQMNSVVEWGGGYGNLCKIFQRLSPSQTTYTIIDTPLLSCLQWLYLSTIFGSERVRLFTHPQMTIEKGKINLIPVCLLEESVPEAQLFLSTWALNESAPFSQDLVIRRRWFGARHLLLAYHDNERELPDSERVAQAARDQGARIEAIDFLPGNHYAFL